MPDELFTWYEFFAGGGMARLGLGPKWKCLFANEWSERKAAAYRAAFGSGTPPSSPELVVQDVAKLTTADLPGTADLVWGSFPCQDLSLAGNGAGLAGERSGTFKPFWKLIEGLVKECRSPRLIVLENVTGALTSHGGKDFAYIITAIASAGYRVGALVVDAAAFLPQSRPRLFFVAVRKDLAGVSRSASAWPDPLWHPAALRAAYAALPSQVQREWVWWSLPAPPGPSSTLSDIISDNPDGVEWHSSDQTANLLSIMSETNLSKIKEAQLAGSRIVGTIYRRTRPDETGVKRQRAEVRFDGIAGCLRTPSGGSSRQFIVVVNGLSIRTRLLSSSEAARLMGVPPSYPIPRNYNEAYHLFGDGLAVPAVRWLSRHLLEKILDWDARRRAA